MGLHAHTGREASTDSGHTATSNSFTGVHLSSHGIEISSNTHGSSMSLYNMVAGSSSETPACLLGQIEITVMSSIKNIYITKLRTHSS